MKSEKVKRAGLWLVTATFAIVMTITGLTSCEKESSTLKRTTYTFSSNEFDSLYNLLPRISYGRLSVIGDGILKFQSLNHFESVYKQLEKNCEIWDSLFLTTHADLSDTLLEDYESISGYDEFLPLVVFEHDYNISSTSLRQAQAAAFDYWMRQNLLGQPPFDPLVNDEVEQSLFNVYHEVCIGDTIYALRKEGVIMIPLDSIENMRVYRQLPFEDISSFFPVIQKSWDGTIEYASIPGEAEYTIDLSPTERVLVVSNTAAWFRMNNTTKPKLVSKIINQKYKANQGKWVKTRRLTKLESSVNFYWQRANNVTGEITDNGLTGVITDSTRTLNRRTLKIKIKGSITEDDGYYYYYGVKRDPQLSVKINNVNHPLSIVF